MTRPQHDAILVCERTVGWIVHVEHPSPHRGPEIIPAKTGDELEEVRVEEVVEGCGGGTVREFFLGPVLQRGLFVVQDLMGG